MERFTWDLFESFDWNDFLHTQQISPRMFVRCWLGIDQLPEQEIVAIEKKRGYRRRCIDLIATVLGTDPRAIDFYGSGIDFEKMPERNRQRLAIALLARQSTQQKVA